MKILCIGDSLTFGYGVYRSQCFVDLLNSNTKNSFINRGVNGDTTSGMLSRSSKLLEEDSYDSVFIMGGSNDLLCGRNYLDIKNNLIFLVNEFLDNNLLVYLLIPPLMEPTLAQKLWYENANYTEINNQILNLKSDFINYINDHKNKNNLSLIPICDIIPNKKEYYIDGVHLTNKGHLLIYDAICKVLN